MFGNVYFRDFKYKLVTHARVFSLEFKNKTLSYREGLYLSTKLFHLKYKFSYSNMASWNKIKNITISLPVINGKIAFKFMEDYVKELEDGILYKVDKYLKLKKLNLQETNGKYWNGGGL